MAYDNSRWPKPNGRSWATLVTLVILSMPCSAVSALLIHTIQLGSYLSEHGANKHYNLVLKKLKEEDRGSLRIERVGKYYALRLGVFADYGDAASKFSRRVKAVNPDFIWLTINLSNSRLVRIFDRKSVEDVLAPPVATAITPVEEGLSEAESTVFEPETLVEIRQTAAIKEQPILHSDQKVEEQAAVTAEDSPPFLSDSLLVSFSIIVSLFMLELYLRTLYRIGTFKSLKWLIVGSMETAVRTAVELPSVGEELQVVFDTGSIAPDAYFVIDGTALANDSLGELREKAVVNETIEVVLTTTASDPVDLPNKLLFANREECDADKGRNITAAEAVTATEESAEIQFEEPESISCQPVISAPIPIKRSIGGGSENRAASSEKEERENRVGRAVLAVSFFAEEKR